MTEERGKGCAKKSHKQVNIVAQQRGKPGKKPKGKVRKSK